MTRSKARLFVYEGGYDAVEIHLPSGRTPTVERGAVFEALPNEADVLASLEGEWREVTKDEADAFAAAVPTIDEADGDVAEGDTEQ